LLRTRTAGWRFDGGGYIMAVPAAEGAGEWPRRPVTTAHEVVERGGFVWLWYGPTDLPADARPPIPHAPELDALDGWTAAYGVSPASPLIDPPRGKKMRPPLAAPRSKIAGARV
jgi:phenylpropionate dioxygenase-like ring-hydroxylating dioxygenase large terminal subunit